MPLPRPSADRTDARRLRAGILAVAALLALALFAPAGALARDTSARHSSCTPAARHSKRERRAGSHCTMPTRRSGRSTKQRRPSKKAPHRGATATKRTEALCEDGSAPVRGAEGFSCADGSEPGCEDGSEPLSAADGEPLCEAAAQPSGESSAGECTEASECEGGQGECQVGEPSPACEVTEGEASEGEALRVQPAGLSSLTRAWVS